MREFVYTLSRVRQSPMALMKRVLFLQAVLNFARRGDLATLDIAIQSILEVYLMFYGITTVEGAIQATAPERFRSYLKRPTSAVLCRRSRWRRWLLQRLLILARLYSLVSLYILADSQKNDFLY